ncbi:hypothetical protein FGO68_gene7015 [Halteria grandinella]|uniref:Uncharacterized protein n=1 Tax=Halteria grandinella TaxID=5974 RepID=A0A8J8T8W8_HALGN|nr:hypothetical protein FGO68_gene7015 [Halteria grandinella]
MSGQVCQIMNLMVPPQISFYLRKEYCNLALKTHQLIQSYLLHTGLNSFIRLVQRRSNMRIAKKMSVEPRLQIRSFDQKPWLPRNILSGLSSSSSDD